MKIKELRRWFSTTIATVAKKRKDSTFLAACLLVLYLLALIFLVGVYKNSFGWGVILGVCICLIIYAVQNRETLFKKKPKFTFPTNVRMKYVGIYEQVGVEAVKVLNEMPKEDRQALQLVDNKSYSYLLIFDKYLNEVWQTWFEDVARAACLVVSLMERPVIDTKLSYDFNTPTASEYEQYREIIFDFALRCGCLNLGIDFESVKSEERLYNMLFHSVSTLARQKPNEQSLSVLIDMFHYVKEETLYWDTDDEDYDYDEDAVEGSNE